jgi:membrane protease YdiL (CAAX protease family)
MIFGILGGIIAAALVLWIVVEYFKNRQVIRSFERAALALAVPIGVLDLVLVVLVARDPSALMLLGWASAVATLKTAAVAAIGLYSVWLLDLPPFRLVRRPIDVPRVLAGAAVTVAFVLTAWAYSWALFALTSPRLNEALIKASEAVPEEATVSAPIIAFGAVLVGVGEEVLFRLGIQNFLAARLGLGRERYWVAILATTVVWTLLHGATLDPEWVKLVQIFPLGIALGFMYRYLGLEVCMASHALFNLVLALSSDSLNVRP